MTSREMITEGKFIMDVSEIPKSDIFPCLAEKEAELNEAREKEGLPRFEVDFDSVYVENETETLYADSYILCQLCNTRLDMSDATEVEDGRCATCSDIMRALGEPMQTPAILAKLEQEMRP